MEHSLADYRIVADSAADLTSLNQVSFSSAPLKIITAEKEYTDNADLDVKNMVDSLKVYKGKSSSSCPNPDEWLAAFSDAKNIIAVTISSGISGSYNAAQTAKSIYEAEHPDRRVFIVDSLSAGPQEAMLVEKAEELILSGMEFDDICKELDSYKKKISLVFILQSLTNFANNGRVSVATAKIAGLLGICIVGRPSDKGTLEPTNKCRGLKKSIAAVIGHLSENGFDKGKIRIAHCFNEDGANQLKQIIKGSFSSDDIEIYPTNGLCSYYAETGGLLIGYEKY